ncbi:MAG: hypothetical protein U0835_02875 [Isosphaeraceae bacterium]
MVVEEFPAATTLRVEENWVRIWRISTVLILLALGDAAWSAWTWSRPPRRRRATAVGLGERRRADTAGATR